MTNSLTFTFQLEPMTSVTRGGITLAQVFDECVGRPAWVEQTLRLLGLPLASRSSLDVAIDEATGLAERRAYFLLAACFVTVWIRLPLLEGEDTSKHDAFVLRALKELAPEFPWGDL